MHMIIHTNVHACITGYILSIIYTHYVCIHAHIYTYICAFVVLEDLRANGLLALSRWKCVLIDECHERSPESDLCLVIIIVHTYKYNGMHACMYNGTKKGTR
jgi:hypothetical protein